MSCRSFKKRREGLAMKLSTKSRYALEALVYMSVSPEGTPISIKQISEKTGISEGYLEQIFFALRKKGLLKTIRGKSGGFLLGSDAQDITAGMVVRAIEGCLVPVACVSDLSACESPVRDQCVTRWLWVTMSDEINAILDSLTLYDLGTAFVKGGGTA